MARGSVQKIDRSDAAAIIQAIKQDGCCIIKNFTSPETVQRVNAEVDPYLKADKPWKGDLFPPETRRCGNLIGRSKTARESWIVDPLFRELLSIFVDQTTSNYYGETKHTYTSEAVLSIAMTFDIGPGAKAQRLHRDDKNYHITHPDMTQTGYQVGTDVELTFMVPGVKTTYENGATLAIPGSHLWGHDRAPRTEESLCAEMEVGDCWVMLGGLYHAGGANITEDDHRLLHGIFFTRGYLRQEENIYLSNTAEDALSWSPQVQKMLGYELSSPNIGAVNFRTPVQFLRGDDGELGDFDESQETK